MAFARLYISKSPPRTTLPAMLLVGQTKVLPPPPNFLARTPMRPGLGQVNPSTDLNKSFQSQVSIKSLAVLLRLCSVLEKPTTTEKNSKRQCRRDKTNLKDIKRLETTQKFIRTGLYGKNQAPLALVKFL